MLVIITINLFFLSFFGGERSSQNLLGSIADPGRKNELNELKMSSNELKMS